MGSKVFNLKENDSIVRCPKCNQNTQFTARSEQVSEDSCDIWVVCKCGFDPTAGNSMNRVEDVWGSLDNENILTALDVWNDLNIKNL